MRPKTYLSVSDMAERYGVHPSTVWRWAKTDPDFPKPLTLTQGCTRWALSSCEAWEAAKRGEIA